MTSPLLSSLLLMLPAASAAGPAPSGMDRPVLSRRAEGFFETRLATQAVEISEHGLSTWQGARQLELRFSGWGHGDTLRSVADVLPEQVGCVPEAQLADCVQGLELRHDGITEWWVAHPEGLQQGWTVSQPETGQGPLVLLLSLPGPPASSQSSSK